MKHQGDDVVAVGLGFGLLEPVDVGLALPEDEGLGDEEGAADVVVWLGLVDGDADGLLDEGFGLIEVVLRPVPMKPEVWAAGMEMIDAAVLRAPEELATAVLGDAAGAPPPPPLPNTRKPTTATPAQPPVTIRPRPRRLGARLPRCSLVPSRSGEVSSSRRVGSGAPERACDAAGAAPRACEVGASAVAALCNGSTRVGAGLGADGDWRGVTDSGSTAVGSSATGSTWRTGPERADGEVGFGRRAGDEAARREARSSGSPSGCASASGSAGSYSSSEESGGRAADARRFSPAPSSSTRGIRTVERTSWTLESSTPVAPQPGHDRAPLRCLRQVLQ